MKTAIKKAKQEYADKMEEKFRCGKSYFGWKMLKHLCELDKKTSVNNFLNHKRTAEQLNQFYARFETERAEENTKEAHDMKQHLGGAISSATVLCNTSPFLKLMS